MAELLNVDPKEEDFDCREEFPGTVYGQVFVCLFVWVKFLLCCMVLESLPWFTEFSSDSLNLMIHVAILS